MQELDETYFIGEINFEESFGKVYVYNNEGNFVPHFHLVVDGKPDVCIMILDNAYFTHGIHKHTLSNKDCRLLNEWMKKPNSKGFDSKVTNWMTIAFAWNLPETHMQIDIKHTKQPDYSTIKPYK